MSMLEKFWDEISYPIKLALAHIHDLLNSAITGVYGYVRHLIKGAESRMRFMTSLYINNLNYVWNAVNKLKDEMRNNIVNIGSKIKATINPLFKEVWDKIAQVEIWVKEKVYTPLHDFILSRISEVKRWVNDNIYIPLKQWTEARITEVKTRMEEIEPEIIEWIEKHFVIILEKALDVEVM